MFNVNRNEKTESFSWNDFKNRLGNLNPETENFFKSIFLNLAENDSGVDNSCYETTQECFDLLVDKVENLLKESKNIDITSTLKSILNKLPLENLYKNLTTAEEEHEKNKQNLSKQKLKEVELYDKIDDALGTSFKVQAEDIKNVIDDLNKEQE